MIPLNYYLVLSAMLFCIGIYGVLTKKNAIYVLMSIEIMLNSVNINFVAFSTYNGDMSGQVFALFSIALAAAEVVGYQRAFGIEPRDHCVEQIFKR